MRYFVVKVNRGGHLQKTYDNMYTKMMKTVREGLIGNVGQFPKHHFLDEITVEEDELSSGERRSAVMGMLRWESSVWALSFVKRAFMSVQEWLFCSCVTAVPGSVNECFVEQVLNEGHVQLLEKRTEEHEACGEVLEVCLVVGGYERKNFLAVS